MLSVHSQQMADQRARHQAAVDAVLRPED